MERIIRGEEQEQKSKEKITNVLPDLKTIRQIWPNILSGYRVFAALMLANLCMLAVGCLGVRFFAKIVSVEKKMLYPIILVISLLGAFSINKNAFDVGVCVAFGIIGWLMNKYEFPLSPILLALILGPMCEKNFVRYMNIQRGNFFAITTSPIAMVFAAVAILVIVFSMYNQSKINKKAAATAQEKA